MLRQKQKLMKGHADPVVVQSVLQTLQLLSCCCYFHWKRVRNTELAWGYNFVLSFLEKYIILETCDSRVSLFVMPITRNLKHLLQLNAIVTMLC